MSIKCVFMFQCFDEAIARQNGMKDDQHVAAYAMYEMGVMLIQTPEVTLVLICKTIE